MPSKKLDCARAFKLARRLERHMRELGNTDATAHMTRVVEALAVTVALSYRAIPSLAPGSLALAILIENPGMADAKIARKAACDPKTLQRDNRYRVARELLAKHKETFSKMSGT